MEQFICIGSGALAREVTALIKDIREFRNFSCKSYCFSSDVNNNDQLFPPATALPSVFYYVVAIGNIHWRSLCIDRLEKNTSITATPINIIHPTAYVSESSLLHQNAGVILFPKVVVMNNVTISRHCLIGSSAVIEHDSFIGTNCVVSPNTTICGNVTVQNNCFIGAGSTLMQRVLVGHSSICGAHSLINKNIAPHKLAYGVPAKEITNIDSNFQYF